MRSLFTTWPYAAFAIENVTRGADKRNVYLGKGRRRVTKASSATSTRPWHRWRPKNDRKTRTCVVDEGGLGGNAWKAARGRRQRRRGPDEVARPVCHTTKYEQTDFISRGRVVETSPFPHGRVLLQYCRPTSYYFTMNEFFYDRNLPPRKTDVVILSKIPNSYTYKLWHFPVYTTGLVINCFYRKQIKIVCLAASLRLIAFGTKIPKIRQLYLTVLVWLYRSWRWTCL